MTSSISCPLLPPHKPSSMTPTCHLTPRAQSPNPSPSPISSRCAERSWRCVISKNQMLSSHSEKRSSQTWCAHFVYLCLPVYDYDTFPQVLRLTSAVWPDPDQLLRQADTISSLIQQRDLLLHQAEEQRLRWNSEQDGWARMAEALLAQQAKNRLNLDSDEVGRRSLACISVTGH